jgi:hypothetical protein
MGFDAMKFLEDYSIPNWDEGKNVSPGWRNIQCPFCSDHSNHGGFNPEGTYICWRCSYHPLEDVISEILQVSYYEAIQIKKEYTTNTRTEIIKKMGIKHASSLSLPGECTDLQKQHRDYLIKRKYDPDKLESKFKLRGTLHYGNYKFRIIAPIYLDGKLVSYQGRDITGKQSLRYKACKMTEEVIHYKHILYNADTVKDRGVIVEGITDVWRLGDGAMATMGTGWTKEQALFIAKKGVKKVFILFDPGSFSTERANKLAWELSFLKVNSAVIYREGSDPGDMPQDEADNFMREVMK